MGWQDVPVAGQGQSAKGAPAWMSVAPVGPPPKTTVKSAAKSAGSGLFDTLASLASQANPAAPVLSQLQQIAKTGSFVMDALKGKIQAPDIVMPGQGEAAAVRHAMGHEYQPQTMLERIANVAGQMAPAAALPGSLPQRAANVIIPTITNVVAGETARANGASPKVEAAVRAAAGAAGGLATGVRIQPKAIKVPVEDAAKLDELLQTIAPADQPSMTAAAAPDQPLSLPKPEASALDYVNKVAGNSALDQVAQAHEIATGAEALGQPGKAALGALARRSGATGEALNAEVTARQLGRPGRMLDAFAQASGVHPEAAAGDIKSLVDAGRAEAAPLYAASESTPMQVTPRLMDLAQRQPVKDAMDQAMKLLESDVSITPEQLAKIKADPNASSTFWDYTHRALSDAAGAGVDPMTGKSSNPNATRIATGLAKEFNTALREAHPPLAKAMDVAGDYLSADSAFKTAGKDIFNAGMTEDQVASRLAKMSDGEKSAYRSGIANKFYDLAQTGRLDPKVLKTPRVQAKLTAALGPDQAKALIETAAKEGDMLAFERRYAPGAGSVTQEMAAAMAEQDASGRGAQMAGDFLGGVAKGHGVGGAATGAISKQIQALLDAIGPTRGMSVEARDAAGRALMLPPSELAKAIEAYRALPRSGVVSYQRPRILTPEPSPR